MAQFRFIREITKPLLKFNSNLSKKSLSKTSQKVFEKKKTHNTIFKITLNVADTFAKNIGKTTGFSFKKMNKVQNQSYQCPLAIITEI